MDLSALNQQQHEAATQLEGPLLVLAGAGSGKTRVLTYRIANLIEQGVAPWHILALTFTNKAAGEMRERIEALVGESVRDMWVTTFHACCARILRYDIEKIGRERNFVIYDDVDQLNVIKKITRELGYGEKDISRRDIRNRISDAKSYSLDPQVYLNETYGEADASARVYGRYESMLLSANALDFDDLILQTIKLFMTDKATLARYRDRFHYVLVDEYQDTDMQQYQLVELLCREHRNICVVGDDDQSIYGWRGAQIRNILEFERDFQGAKTVRLEQNYRSTSNILDAANHVVSNNQGRKPKTLWTDLGEGEKIALYAAANERDEADFLCRTILTGQREGKSYNDYAVLYRMNAQSRVIEIALKNYGIPCKIVGGVSFYRRREIKDIMAYLRLIYNPRDDEALMRIINVPRRAIGDVTVNELARVAAAQDLPMLVCAITGDGLDDKVKRRVQPFAQSMLDFAALSRTIPLHELVTLMVESLEYEKHLQTDDGAGDFNSRMENVLEFIGSIKSFELGLDGDTNPLQAFLENVALISDLDDMDEVADTVTLLTLHSAKGLEFSEVFITGMEENIFPTARARSEMASSAIEEERRLCYVGITRARQKLYLTYAGRRNLFGNDTYNRPSRFLEEIPEAYVEDVSPAARVSEQAQDENAYAGRQRTSRRTRVASTFTGGFGTTQPYVKQSAKLPSMEFEPYQRVNHAKFGDGTVLEVSGTGSATTVKIYFECVGEKRFAAAYAPITATD